MPQISRRAILHGISSAAALLPLYPGAGRAEQLTRESVYNYVIIEKEKSVVSFRRVENGEIVSAIDLSNRERQVIPYTRYLFLPALIDASPRTVLNIGLGAGAFNRLFNAAFPRSQLTTVEIDPMIVAIAREFTGFIETADNRVEIADGRRFLRKHEASWDWIVLDAYVRKSQIPPHLTTAEFFQLVRSRLAADGIFVGNIAGSSEFIRRVAVTIESVFPGSVFWPVPGSGNVIATASLAPQLETRLTTAGAPKLDFDLVKCDVDLPLLAKGPHWSVTADSSQILTDDFAPTEYLNRD